MLNLEKNSVKITFLGDITCDRPMIKAADNGDGSFNFDDSFIGIKELVESSDFTVGNLETVFAGKHLGYNPKPVSYNSPEDLLKSIKLLGVDMLTTANNHCLDFGIEGLESTHRLLNEYNIYHTGTNSKETESETYKIIDFNGIRVAFLAYTDSINPKPNGVRYSRKILKHLNYIGYYKKKKTKEIIKDTIKTILPMEIINEIRANYKRKKGIKIVNQFIDDNPLTSEDIEQIKLEIKKIKKIKDECDFLVLLLHAGGQFNLQPGKHTEQIVDMLLPHVDLIVGHHPHVIQKIERKDDKVVAYSLGGLNMSMSADYIHHEVLPNYSAYLNLYLEKSKDGEVSNFIDIGFIKNEEDNNNYTKLSLVDEDTLCNQFEISEYKKLKDRVLKSAVKN